MLDDRFINNNETSMNCGSGISRKWIVVSLLTIMVGYFATVSVKWWPTPDSSLYLGLARSLESGNGFSFNGEITNIVTPGMPLILAGIIRVFGENYWVMNLFVAICAVLTLWLAYLSILEMTSDRRISLAVLICTAVSFDFYRISRLILTDTTFCMLFWVMIFAIIKYVKKSWLWLILAIVAVGLALSVRIPGILIIGPLAVSLMFFGIRGASLSKRWIVSGTILVVPILIAGFFYILSRQVHSNAPPYIRGFVEGKASDVVVSLFAQLWQGLLELPRTMSDMTISQSSHVVGGLVLLLLVAGCFVAWKRSLGFLGMLWWLSVFAFALVSGATGVRTRYLLALMPIMFLLVIWGTLWFYGKMAKWRNRNINYESRRVAVTVFVIIIAGFNLPRVFKAAMWCGWSSYGDDYYSHLREGRYEDVFKVAYLLKADKNITPIYANDLSVLHYLTGKTINPLPQSDIGTNKSAAVIEKFLLSPECRGYIAIEHKKFKSQNAIAVMDGMPEFQKVFSGKYMSLYRKGYFRAAPRRLPAATGLRVR